jgi:hypothetical protein
MKKGYIAAVVVGSLLALSPAAANAGWIGERQERQRARIGAGTDSGALTSRESRTLRREQRAIDRGRYQALSDGYMSRHEARRLARAQNRAGDRIFCLKHNRRVAP